MKRNFLWAAALMLTVTAHAQTQSASFDVPQQVTLKTEDDFATYEKDIIAADKWLIATPLNEQQGKRAEVSAFVIRWISGSPKLSVALHPCIGDFEKANKGMMMLYMAGCARYAIEKKAYTDVRAQQKAALQDMILVYKSGKGINKDKAMDKVVKADKEGKLDTWINENLPLS